MKKLLNGKAYANRKKHNDRPESDFYETPRSLVWELLKTNELAGCNKILEPCCGNYAISKELEEHGFSVVSKDLKYGDDFLLADYEYDEFDAIVTNPPFSLWSEIVEKARSVCSTVIVIGKTNFFGVHSRNESGFWNGLKEVYIFDRQVEYRTPSRKDGLFMVGCLVTGWFVFDNNYTGFPRIHIMDVQQYAKLGSFETYIKNLSKGENKK